MALPSTNFDIEELKNKIKDAENICIIMHHNPDGDALGSSLATYQLLKNSGKFKVNVISPNEYPEFLFWLKGNDDVIIGNRNKKKTIKILKECDFLFLLDFNVLNRIDWIEEHLKELKCTKLLIDHHPEPENFADYIISDTSVSSTAELCYNFFVEGGWKKLIDKNIGESLYTGIMTDTGCFSHNSSHPETFETVAELLRIGIDKNKVYSKVYYNYSFDRMKFLGLALNKKMHHYPEYRTAFIVLTKKEQENYNFQPGDSEGFVNYPLSVKGTIFSAFFLEKDDYVKISFRSTGKFRVNEFSSKHFNGGGHLNAAGGESYDSIQETVQKFVNLLPDYSNQLNKNE